jgi:hypothetical protein
VLLLKTSPQNPLEEDSLGLLLVGFAACSTLFPIGRTLCQPHALYEQRPIQFMWCVAGHLLPKPAVSEEERKAEDEEAGSSNPAATGNESGKGGSGNTPAKLASNSQGGFSRPGVKGEAGDRGEPSGGYKAHVAPAGMVRGGLDGVSMTEKGVRHIGGDTKSTTSAGEGHKKRGLEGGGSQPNRKGPQMVRDKEIDRLQFENDLLRETLRQREQLQDLQSEVEALREALGSQVLVSGRNGAAGQCADAHIGHMCFKCQQFLRRRR